MLTKNFVRFLAVFILMSAALYQCQMGMEYTPMGMAMNAASAKKEEDATAAGAKGAPPDEDAPLTEQKAKEIIKKEIKPLRESIVDANGMMNKKIDNITIQFEHQMNKKMAKISNSIQNMTNKMHKQLRVIEKKISSTVTDTDKLTLVSYEQQIDAKTKELKAIEKNIVQLEYILPPFHNVCDGIFNCSGCIAEHQCGWCQMEQQCISGDHQGPFYTSCNEYQYDRCQSKNCLNFDTCQGCISNPICGWCDDDSLLNTGCIEEGPDYKDCGKKLWFQITGNKTVCEKKPLTEEPYIPKQFQSNDTVVYSDQKIGIEDLTPHQRRQLYTKKQLQLRQNMQDREKTEAEIKFLKNNYEILKQSMQKYKDIKQIQKQQRDEYFDKGDGEGEDKEEKEETSDLPNGPAATESTSDGESVEVEDGEEEDIESTTVDVEEANIIPMRKPKYSDKQEQYYNNIKKHDQKMKKEKQNIQIMEKNKQNIKKIQKQSNYIHKDQYDNDEEITVEYILKNELDSKKVQEDQQKTNKNKILLQSNGYFL